MVRFVGFEAQSGSLVSKDTGEVIPWSNRLLRFVTDDFLGEREFGLKIGEQKLKTTLVKQSLKLGSQATEEQVNAALVKILNHKIDFKFRLTKSGMEPSGFVVLSDPVK